ncbi:hypothetical protein EVAR_50640_1 [Eumeta japonica]|uniref:Uncharacterized protein n=1 Tax=Eumeta variegata TaxID=151549 RepID=A0A4C1XFU4_EUMVA|nr:hypothetical protein EVAR_50640_1 [Eumeta japonica]
MYRSRVQRPTAAKYSSRRSAEAVTAPPRAPRAVTFALSMRPPPAIDNTRDDDRRISCLVLIAPWSADVEAALISLNRDAKPECGFSSWDD